MSFPVDYTTTIDGVTIKCSKTFDQLGTITADDLREYAIAGIYDIAAGRSGISKSAYLNGQSDVETNTPIVYRNSTGGDVWVNYGDGTYNPPYSIPHYGFSILVYGSEGQCIKSTTNNTRLVLDINIQKIYADIAAFSDNTITAVRDEGISSVPSFTYKASSRGSIKTVDNNSTISNLACMDVFIYDDTNFFIFPSSYVQGVPFINTTYNFHGNTGNASGQVFNSAAVVPYYATTYEGQSAIYAAMANDTDILGTSLESIDFANSFVCILDTGDQEKEQTNAYVVITYSGVWDFNGSVNYYPKDGERQALLGCANSSIKFKVDGTLYKPVIEDGVVVDYTDDMDEPSEFDDIETVTGNNVPVTPPVPPTPQGEDDMETQVLGATGSSGGFTKFFVMSPKNLSDFLTDFYSRADSGETLSNNLVCSYILGVPSSDWCTTENIPITINNSAQGTPFVSAANYKHVTATNNYIVAGNIEVPRKTGTFYDFAPYSTYELFIPCCGWITLPDTVAGRHIYVSIQIDIATCGAKGVVKFDDGATCAVCSGVLGSNIPMQIIESGLLRGANVQAASSALGCALMAGSGFGNGNVGLGLNGISNVVNAFTQSAIAGNTNYTNQKGSSGDITQFAMGHNCYLKITYPPVDEVVNNSMFGHTVGYLCEEVGTLSSFHGFTVCANPHVHINATSTERDEITQLLEQGVILPYGE